MFMTNTEHEFNAIHPHFHAIVRAIRNDKEVGLGTCSIIDECMSDVEAVETFGWDDAALAPRTAFKALVEARRWERAQRSIY